MPIGSPDKDWFQAEGLLKNQHKRLELPMHVLFALSMKKRTMPLLEDEYLKSQRHGLHYAR